MLLSIYDLLIMLILFSYFALFAIPIFCMMVTVRLVIRITSQRTGKSWLATYFVYPYILNRKLPR